MDNNKKIIIGVAVVAVLAIVALVATSGGKQDAPATSNSNGGASNTSTEAPSDAVATNAITISDYLFGPKAITVKVGDTVTWTNQDSVKHNVVSDDTSADAPNGPLIGKGETYSFTFKKAGTYNYYCQPHPYMKGTVVVTE